MKLSRASDVGNDYAIKRLLTSNLVVALHVYEMRHMVYQFSGKWSESDDDGYAKKQQPSMWQHWRTNFVEQGL